VPPARNSNPMQQQTLSYYPEAARAAKYLVAGPKRHIEGAGGAYSHTRGGNKAGRVARSAVWFWGGVSVCVR
jgi:hypothetical protein